jgi:hypothetical protein
MGAPGFDDAPYAELATSIEPKHITFVYPYYENPKFLRRQIGWWLSYPAPLRERLSVIVVDDGSPRFPAEDVVRQYFGDSFVTLPPFFFRLFRIDVDVRWNWLAARNIAAHHAEYHAWLLLTDMDHVVTARVLRSVQCKAHKETAIYRFSRAEHTGVSIHPHPNSMLMTRAMYWRVGGYDEALSGHYGTDGDYRRRCAQTASVYTLQDELIRHEYDGDSSTTAYKRKQPEDAGKKAIIAKRGKNWRPRVLTFPFHEINLCSK